jgi:rRNA 2'-O-methyltransferase fibrillarin
VGLNGQYFLKNGGNFVISIKASCIDSTAVPEAVFAREVKKLQEMQMKPKEQVRGHTLQTVLYRLSRLPPTGWPIRSCCLKAPRNIVCQWFLICLVPMQVTLEPYERDHAMVVGVFRPPPKVKS